MHLKPRSRIIDERVAAFDLGAAKRRSILPTRFLINHLME